MEGVPGRGATVSLVLDSSITLAWLYSDEASPAADRVFTAVIDSGAFVPAIWPLEIGNALLQGIRRGRIDAQFRDESLADLGALDISVDSETNTFAWTTALKLADRFRLTPYDASYLELAERRGLPLATI